MEKYIEDDVTCWSELIPLPTLSNSMPEFPLDNIPSVIADMIQGVSVSTETPIELSFTFSLGALAAAIQGKFFCEIWKGYEEELACWPICYCASGERKTAVFKKFTAPIILWEAKRLQAMKSKIVEAQERLKNQEAKVLGLRKKLAIENDSIQQASIEAEIMALVTEMVSVPIAPRIMAEDITPERLASLMSEHGGRMALMSDEAGIFGILAGRYNKGVPNLDVFLKGFSGSSFNADRQGSDRVHLERPLLTIALSPQPMVLEQIGNHPEFRGRGLLARFLHLVPKSMVGYRSNEFLEIPDEIELCYKSILNHFLDFEANAPVKISFSQEARTLHKQRLAEIEIQLRNGGELSSLDSWALKLMGTIARISSIFTLVENVHRLSEPLEISAEIYERTASLIPFFKAHALKAFGLMKQSPEDEGAVRIIEWIEQKQIVSFSARSCFAAHKYHFRTMKKFLDSIRLLRDHQYLKGFVFKPEEHGRPSQRLCVNPSWIENGIDYE